MCCSFFRSGGARDIEQGLVAYSCPFPIGTPEATEFLSNASLALYVMPMPRSDDDASDDATMPSISALKSIMKEGHAKKVVHPMVHSCDVSGGSNLR